MILMYNDVPCREHVLTVSAAKVSRLITGKNNDLSAGDRELAKGCTAAYAARLLVLVPLCLLMSSAAAADRCVSSAPQG